LWWVSIANNIWIWGEVIVLLFNEKRRAIHDFMAGILPDHQVDSC